VDGPWDYYASLSARNREGYREHSDENTELWFSDLGYKFNDHLENRFYLTADQTDRLLPGGIDQATLQRDPQQGDPNAAPLDYDKQWYYVRLADKLSYERAGQKLDAEVYWWHRELHENGYYSPTNYQQGIQIYHADDGGVNLSSVTHSQLFGQQNILTAGLSPAIETEQDHNYANLGGAEGQTIAKDLELSVNVPVYLENQHYLTERLSLLTGLQAIYALRHFYDDFNDTIDGDQSAEQNFFGLNPKIGLLYELTDDSQAFVNFNRSFQPPSFDSMVTFDDGAGAGLVYCRSGRRNPGPWRSAPAASRVALIGNCRFTIPGCGTSCRIFMMPWETTEATSMSTVPNIKASKRGWASHYGIPKRLTTQAANG
jgi:iron complex outermembrane receptor protein